LRSRALTALVVALAMALGAVACGDDEEEPTTTTAEGKVSGTTGPQTEETVPTEPQEDEPEQTGGEQAVPRVAQNAPEDALADALTSGEPRVACEKAVTQAYVSAAYGSVQGCRSAQAGEGLAKDVTLVEATLQPPRGKGTVRFQGGIYDGEEGKFALVLEDETWKLDSLEVDVPPGP
jgi:hypothetical protein